MKGIYKNNKSGNEYLIFDVGLYAQGDGNPLGTVVDATNMCDGKVRNIYYIQGEYFATVKTHHELIGKKFVMYHKRDEFHNIVYYIREMEEFKEKFTFDRLY